MGRRRDGEESDGGGTSVKQLPTKLIPDSPLV